MPTYRFRSYQKHVPSDTLDSDPAHSGPSSIQPTNVLTDEQAVLEVEVEVEVERGEVSVVFVGVGSEEMVDRELSKVDG